jgi:predicted RNase H-like HicB family nuclease
MTYNAVLESQQDKGYTATILGWPGCSAAGSTREEALGKVREALRQRLSEVEIVPLEVEEPPQSSHPWLRFAGMFRDDPLFDEVEAGIQSYRQELDADEDTV